MNYSSWSIFLSMNKVFQNLMNTKTDISNSDIPAHQKVFFSSSLSSPGWIRWDQWFSRHTCIFSCCWCFISEILAINKLSDKVRCNLPRKTSWPFATNVPWFRNFPSSSWNMKQKTKWMVLKLLFTLMLSNEPSRIFLHWRFTFPFFKKEQ